MKVVLLLVFTHVVLETYAITVPPVWPKQATKYQQPRYHQTTHIRPNRQNVYTVQQPVHINKYRNTQFQTESHWMPITPNPGSNQHVYNQKPNIIYTSLPITIKGPQIYKRPYKIKNNYKQPNAYQTISYNRPIYNSHADKNVPFSPIRGSYIHSLPPFTAGRDHYDVTTSDQRLPENNEEIKQNYNSPVSEHEIPKEVPTKPIYPGEGQWARPGIKHTPYISTQTYSKLKQDEEKPDGYDIFENGEERFRQAQNKFKFNVNNNPNNYKTHETQYDENHSSPVNEKTDSDFVPQKLYAQVRRTETKKHLPRSEIDEDEDTNASRLREIIKDSKIQTVYSEEGYEDSAYDHAGKEKKAESAEGHARKEEGAEKRAKQNFGDTKTNYAEEGGHHRGQIKHKRTKGLNELSRNKNFDNVETYEDIREKVEQEAGREHDSESAGSEYAIKVPLSKKVGPLRNLQTNKDAQKIEIKSSLNNGNDINMEIHTEVKIMNGPEKKKHKFVKIVPSYQKIEEINMKNQTEENLSSKRRVKRYNRDKLSRIYVRKRPNYYWKKRNSGKYKPEVVTKKVKAEYTTIANGKVSTSTIKSSTTTTKQIVPVSIKIRTRQKRYTIDHPNIDVSLEKFVDIENLSGGSTKKPDLTHRKYPYFKMKSDLIHEHSPLRYSQDLESIPLKTQNEMAFYDSRDKIQCPIIEESVDPIPDRIKNKTKDDENEEMGEEPVGPRLGGLGDKIDCLKVKYFGENPLDSPIFTDELVKLAIPPIFKNNKKTLKAEQDNVLKENKMLKYNNFDTLQNNLKNKNSTKRELRYLDPIIVPDEEIDVSVTINPSTKQSEAVLKPPYTFKQMVDKLMKKNKNIPKSIYDQISLLENSEEEKTTLKNENESPEFLIIYNNQNAIKNKINTLTPTTKGYIDPRVSDIVPELGNLSQELPNNEIINLVPENFTEHDLILPSGLEDASKVTENHILSTIPSPTYSALKDAEKVQEKVEEKPMYLPIRVPVDNQEVYKNSQRKYSSFIFDISKYLPQIKNHKTVTSEVQYKDEIKPSEQMNVYSDVLKAINISTQEFQEASADNSQPITVKLHVTNNTKTSYPKRRIRIRTTTPYSVKTIKRIKKPDLIKDGSNNIDVKQNLVPNVKKTTPQIFPTEVPVTPKNLPQKIKNMISQYTNPLIINVPDIEYSQESLEITGLAPPTNKYQYRTLPTPQRANPTEKNRQLRNINTFFVAGLRPPPLSQSSMSYSDYMSSTRRKRQLYNQFFEDDEDMNPEESNVDEEYQAPSRKSIVYTEIIRSRMPKPDNEDDEDEEDDEEEDLLPRKRVYEFKTKIRTSTTEKDPEEELFEYEPPTTKKTVYSQPKVYEKPTGLPDYIKIIDKLHDYRFVNNITTTLPEQETTTANPRTSTTSTTPRTQMVAESISVGRGEPAFLQVIDQLHEIRKDLDPTTTTEEPNTSPVKMVQNSNPYIVSEALSSSVSEDISDDPDVHVRNLREKLRSRVDTSKYKTIERKPIVLRHNLSSRYNSEDEVLPLEKMFTTKMPAVYTTTTRSIEGIPVKEEQNAELASQKEVPKEEETTIEVIAVRSTTEDVKPVSSSTTTVSPRRRMRPRGRPTSTTKSVTSTINPPIRRRRPTRPPSTTTEAAQTTVRSYPLFNRRRLRPSPQLDSQTSIKSYVSEIPPNHKKEYVPVTEVIRNVDSQIVTENKPQRPNEKKKRRLEKLHERRVTSEYSMTRYYNPEELEEPVNNSESKKTEYEIIGEIKNPEMKHGGNYKHINDTSPEETLSYVEQNGGIPPMDRNGELDTNLPADYSLATPREITTIESEKVSTWKPFNINNNLHRNRYTNLQLENNEDNVDIEENRHEEDNKPKIIKDPSKRMYYYAKL